MSESDVYLLGRSGVEEERFRKQSEELAGEAQWLLDQLDVRPGASAIDLGCGPRGVLELLSARVGAKGRVVGLEARQQFVESGRTFTGDRRTVNVHFVQVGCIGTRLPQAS